MTKDNGKKDKKDKKDKKEKVIHTRVSELLDDELKDRASDLGVSVSNLVRNVLLNTFGLVENIVADTAKAAGVAKSGGATTAAAESATPVASTEIIGYQSLTLNRNALCTTCNSILPKGSQASMGVTASGAAGADAILCNECVNKVGEDDQ